MRSNEQKLKEMVLLLMHVINGDSLEEEGEAMSKAYKLMEDIDND